MDIKFETKKDFFSNLDSKKDLLSDKELSIYNYIKKNYKKVAYTNITEICKNLGLEKEDLNTFSSKVGFKSYESLRTNLREVIMTQLKTTDRFRISQDLKSLDIDNVLDTVVNTEIKNLTNLLNSVDKEILKSIVKEILGTEEMIILGTRTSAPIAIYAEYIFNRIGRKTRKIISGGTEVFDDLTSLERNTLILAFGFARYPKETIKTLNYFKKKNFKIISITDSIMSPLAHFSDIVLNIPYEGVSFTDFYAVPTSIVNILVTLVSQYDEERTLKYLNEFENIAKDMGFYF